MFQVSIVEQSLVKIIYFSSVNHMLLFPRPHTDCVWHYVGHNLSSFSCWDSHINHPDVRVSIDSEFLLVEFTLVSKNKNVHVCLLIGGFWSSNNFQDIGSLSFKWYLIFFTSYDDFFFNERIYLHNRRIMSSNILVFSYVDYCVPVLSLKETVIMHL